MQPEGSGARRWRRLTSIALIAGVGLAAAPRAHATVVRQASLAELVKISALVVHAVVESVDDSLAASPRGPFRTAVQLHIFSALKGSLPADGELRLVLPGGRGYGRTLAIPGMPHFAAGDEVVLLLEALPRGGYALTGLAQGVFRVSHRGSVPTVSRPGAGMTLLEGGKLAQPTLLPAPETLPALLTTLRTLTGSEAEP